MIGLALAIIVIGILFGLVWPWVGILLGLAGLALLLALLSGFGRGPSGSADRRSR
jgi:phosphotransferase system  glucose/maltose/N-acetylglucosamine-specific IIC component